MPPLLVLKARLELHSPLPCPLDGRWKQAGAIIDRGSPSVPSISPSPPLSPSVSCKNSKRADVAFGRSSPFFSHSNGRRPFFPPSVWNYFRSVCVASQCERKSVAAFLVIRETDSCLNEMSAKNADPIAIIHFS